MKIGIDIDDTVSMTHDKIIKEAYKYDKEHVKGKGFKDPNAYSFMEMFYWTVLDVDGFMKYIRSGSHYSELEPIKGASKVVSKLYDEGNEIIFITRRQNNLKVKMITKKWLKKNGFKFNKLIMGISKKGELCNELGIDLLIDNDIKNIYDALDYKVDGILMGDRYNKDETDLNRVESWEEVYKYIKGAK